MERHAPSKRGKALELSESGLGNVAVAARLGVPVGTVGWWLHEDRKARGITVQPTHRCPRCLNREPSPRAYSYLLGLYLSDGHIISKPHQHHLSLYCGNTWPGLIDAAQTTMSKVLPDAGTGRRAKIGCFEVKSYSKHWPCLFPQHGPGTKHERLIALEPWQQSIVDRHPWRFIRGLIHSDGCRITNWTTRMVGGERERYEYPRYFFTNKSDDIRALFSDALDAVGVEWKVTRRGEDPFNIRRAAGLRRADGRACRGQVLRYRCSAAVRAAAWRACPY